MCSTASVAGGTGFRQHQGRRCACRHHQAGEVDALYLRRKNVFQKIPARVSPKWSDEQIKLDKHHFRVIRGIDVGCTTFRPDTSHIHLESACGSYLLGRVGYDGGPRARATASGRPRPGSAIKGVCGHTIRYRWEVEFFLELQVKKVIFYHLFQRVFLLLLPRKV